MGDTLRAQMEKEFEGFQASFGGEELKRSTATLCGALVGGALKLSINPGSNTEELDYHIRELAFAAKQYAGATADNPNDFDALYHHGLVLQELASKLQDWDAKTGSTQTEQISFLQQACQLYQSALNIQPNAHAALYNWGVALSDLARALKPHSAVEARACLQLASQKYAESLALCPNNPRALNNWGLVLQELSADVKDGADRDALVAHALHKFRLAVRCAPDFDRGCYNLGTVFYTYACTLQTEMAAHVKGAPGVGDNMAPRSRSEWDASVRRLFSIAALYICLSYALQPTKDIYRKGVSVVRNMLPLPFLRAGHLTAPRASSLAHVEEAWRRDWFVLDHASLRSASPMESSLSTIGHSRVRRSNAEDEGEPLVVPLTELLAVRCVSDPSLPEGAAFWVCTTSRLQGVYFVAEDAETANAWVDALVLAQHLVQTRGQEALVDALAPASAKRAAARASAAAAAAAAVAAAATQQQATAAQPIGPPPPQ